MVGKVNYPKMTGHFRFVKCHNLPRMDGGSVDRCERHVGEKRWHGQVNQEIHHQMSQGKTLEAHTRNYQRKGKLDWKPQAFFLENSRNENPIITQIDPGQQL